MPSKRIIIQEDDRRGHGRRDRGEYPHPLEAGRLISRYLDLAHALQL